jgi:hypothetical protein
VWALHLFYRGATPFLLKEEKETKRRKEEKRGL